MVGVIGHLIGFGDIGLHYVVKTISFILLLQFITLSVRILVIM